MIFFFCRLAFFRSFKTPGWLARAGRPIILEPIPVASSRWMRVGVGIVGVVNKGVSSLVGKGRPRRSKAEVLEGSVRLARA